jgi:cytochrome c-type biogenesis protein CcmH/NrfF
LIKRLAQLTFIALLAFGAIGADYTSPRFEKLGHRLMCTCGCNQILLECNHVGCPASDGMRNELTAGMQKSASDDGVLDIFVQKYGPIVLAAPTMSGFNRVAWIMPYAMFALGIALVSLIVRNWKHRAAVRIASSDRVEDPAMQDFRRRAREETQL